MHATPPPPSPEFARDEALLTTVLHDVVRASGGPQVVELMDEAVDLGRAARAGDPDAADRLAALTAGLDAEAASVLVRALTRWFQLINLAEDNERVRRLGQAAARVAPGPRPGSVRAAVAELLHRGTTAEEIGALVAGAQLELVMTAHPTEARRRTTVDKLARVFGVLRDLDERPSADRDDALRILRATVQELWTSDDVRAASLGVLDEVRGGLLHFSTTLAQTIPQIYRELESAVAEWYPGAEMPVAPVLRFGSWIGGDRDGNPLVTPKTTVEALGMMREQCLRFLETRLETLAGRLSLSVRITPEPAELDAILAEGEDAFPALAEQLAALNAEEPFRRAVTFMRERVRAAQTGEPGAYGGADELLADLRLIEECLVREGARFTAAGDLRDVIRQVEVFGFHFATLDIREHAGVHRRALDEVYVTLGVTTGYAELDEEDRIALLCASIADHRPLIPWDIEGFSPSTREAIDTFRVLRGALDADHRGAVRSYIVSGTEGPADLLEVLVLMKEASLSRAGGEDARLRIVPLFEARATLADSAATMDRVLREPVYRAALRAVGDEQEVMIGYSDSNKDAGYLASGWGAYRAQIEVSRAVAAHGARCMFFHGRGGAIGRGGGPTNQAILALPPGTVHARLKMTEQGEVLTAKYAVAPIAHRELELATSAALVAGAGDPIDPRWQAVMEEMADTSADRYRATVHDDPDFARFFAAVTPLSEVSRLRLGSRPARRRAGAGIDELRAIPWVFSWTQSRIVLPAWFGLGTALAEARERHGMDVLREMLEHWAFFQTLIANAEMGLAKADPMIGERYTRLWEETATRDRIWAVLGDEMDRTRAELLALRDADRLLDSEPLLQASIDRRNPFVDPLSFVQIALLQRLQDLDAVDREELERVSLLTINGIASGLRNTG